MSLIKKISEKLSLKNAQHALKGALKPNQQVAVRLDISPHTFITRIESVDDEYIYVAGISNEELDFSLPVPNQKMEIHVFSESMLCKAESTFYRRIHQPVHMWVLEKPKSIKSYKERRRMFRFEHVSDVEFKAATAMLKEQVEAVTKNISIGGLAIVSPVNLPLGEKIEINLPEIDDIRVMGEVVWKYQRPFFDKWYYGIRFTDADESVENNISNYINEKLRKLKWAGLE